MNVDEGNNSEPVKKQQKDLMFPGEANSSKGKYHGGKFVLSPAHRAAVV